MSLLQPPTPDEVAGKAAPPVLVRSAAEYHDHSQKYSQGLGTTWKCQYAQIYFERLTNMRAMLERSAAEKWKGLGVPYVPEILKIPKDRKCYFIGTLYKDMRAKPNILEEYHARENYEAPPPERSKYHEPDDSLSIEDHTGRALLSGVLSPADLVTGVVVAVLGTESALGDFCVEDYCFAGTGDSAFSMPVLPAGPDKYVALVSGLNVGKGSEQALLLLEMLVDFVTGQAGGEESQKLSCSISSLVVAGNLIGNIVETTATQARYKTKSIASETVTHMKEVDEALGLMAACLPLCIMPGPHDPANETLPQQPLQPCLFPCASLFSTVRGVSNPYAFQVDGVNFLGTSGQGVDDVFRFSAKTDRLDILTETLRWRHLFPTAPDTLGCFPYYDQDPFIIAQMPHVYFAGNQPAFQTSQLEVRPGHYVTLVCVPQFDSTGTIVLLNLRTLQASPVTFRVPME